MTLYLPPLRDRAIAYIRTYVPVLVGSLLTWLLTRLPAVADFASYLPDGWRDFIAYAAAAVVIALYYWGARQLGKRWPGVEKWLLGSSAVPVYTATS